METAQTLLRHAHEGFAWILNLLDNPPGWLTVIAAAVLSGIVGFFSAFFGQLIVPNLVARRNMQLVIYRDLANMYWTINGVLNPAPDEIHLIRSRGLEILDWQRSYLEKSLMFHGEKHCAANPAILLQLSERFAVEMLYRVAHEILSDPVGLLPMNCHRFLIWTGSYLKDDGLRPKLFKKYLGRKTGSNFIRMVRALKQKNDGRVQSIVDASRTPPSNSLAQ